MASPLIVLWSQRAATVTLELDAATVSVARRSDDGTCVSLVTAERGSGGGGGSGSGSGGVTLALYGKLAGGAEAAGPAVRSTARGNFTVTFEKHADAAEPWPRLLRGAPPAGVIVRTDWDRWVDSSDDDGDHVMGWGDGDGDGDGDIEIDQEMGDAEDYGDDGEAEGGESEDEDEDEDEDSDDEGEGEGEPEAEGGDGSGDDSGDAPSSDDAAV